MATIHVVSLSGGRDSAAVGIWAAREFSAGRIPALRYVNADVGSGPRGMESGSREWLAMYEAKVLTPRGLHLETVTAQRSDQADYEDAWATVYERHGKRPVLPGPMFRTCTWRLKIEPIQRWRHRTFDAETTVTWIVGFRVDEGAEKRRLQPARLADDNGRDEHWRPFVELRWGLDRVRQLMAEEGVPEPDFYEWTTRSGCVLCFYKPRRELVEAAKRYPATFERMADLEERVIAATKGTPRARWEVTDCAACGGAGWTSPTDKCRECKGKGVFRRRRTATEAEAALATIRRRASPYVVTRGGTLREIVADAAAQTELDIDERKCGDPLGTCLL